MDCTLGCVEILGLFTSLEFILIWYNLGPTYNCCYIAPGLPSLKLSLKCFCKPTHCNVCAFFLFFFQSYCKSESPSNMQKLKNDKNLVNGIIQNLPDHYADQVRKGFLSTAFTHCRSENCSQLIKANLAELLGHLTL